MPSVRKLSQTRKRIKVTTPKRVSERIRKQGVDVSVPERRADVSNASKAAKVMDEEESEFDSQFAKVQPR